MKVPFKREFKRKVQSECSHTFYQMTFQALKIVTTRGNMCVWQTAQNTPYLNPKLVHTMTRDITRLTWNLNQMLPSPHSFSVSDTSRHETVDHFASAMSIACCWSDTMKWRDQSMCVWCEWVQASTWVAKEVVCCLNVVLLHQNMCTADSTLQRNKHFTQPFAIIHILPML